MQLNLIFPDTPLPHAHVWEALDEETRRAVLEQLAEQRPSGRPDQGHLVGRTGCVLVQQAS